MSFGFTCSQDYVGSDVKNQLNYETVGQLDGAKGWLDVLSYNNLYDIIFDVLPLNRHIVYVTPG